MKLTDNFLEPYRTREIPEPFGPLGAVVYARTYSRDGERWVDTCQRVVEECFRVQKEHCDRFKLPWNGQKAQASAKEMFDRMFRGKFLPAGRGLFSMGTDYVRNRSSAALFNCCFVSTLGLANNPTSPFEFMADMLMLGVGVGFDTLGAGSVKVTAPKEVDEVYTLEDSKEGWVEGIRETIGAYLCGKPLRKIDFSAIRPAGSPILGYGGVAPGPEPLIRGLEDMRRVLDAEVGNMISVSTIVDLMNLCGRIVVAGGVRRSAQIALGEATEEYLNLKDPEDPRMLEWRWASNNSVYAKAGDDYTKIAERIAKNGEPGVVWIDNARYNGRMGEFVDDGEIMGVNPCGELFLSSPMISPTNRASGELCNLVSVFPSKHDSLEDFKRTVKFAYLYGKTVTLLPTHREEVNAIIMRNRRIGLSMGGIVQAVAKHGYREFLSWCDDTYEYTKDLDKTYSDWLCIPRSIKMTTVVPSGTTSHLAGVTPGIHFPHSEYYYRTIRIDQNSGVLEPLRKAGYYMEESLYNDNAYVVYFPTKEENFDRSKEEVSMWEQLELAAQMQEHWADNGVSVTVTFKPEEAKDIAHALSMYETRLKAVSFLPLVDHQYKQAPYITIDKEEYERAISALKPLDLSSVVHEAEEKFCNGEACEVGK